MSRVKYNLIIILFALVVAGGVSVVLSGFNQMIRPAGPVSAFRLEGGGPGVYRLEFLGEKIAVQIPPGLAADLVTRVEIMNRREYVTKTLQKLEREGKPVLDETLAIIIDAMKRTGSDLESRAGELKKQMTGEGFRPEE